LDLLALSDAPFLPGMSANVEIQTQVKTQIPSLPIEAIGTRTEEDTTTLEERIDEVIFSIEEGRAVKHVIQTGIQDSRYIEIVSGIEGLEEVIVGPYDAISKKLKKGTRVAISTASKSDKLEKK
jgi:HlyD family secretion protein